MSEREQIAKLLFEAGYSSVQGWSWEHVDRQAPYLRAIALLQADAVLAQRAEQHVCTKCGYVTATLPVHALRSRAEQAEARIEAGLDRLGRASIPPELAAWIAECFLPGKALA